MVTKGQRAALLAILDCQMIFFHDAYTYRTYMYSVNYAVRGSELWLYYSRDFEMHYQLVNS